MTARGKEAAALALHRFGFGPARDSIAAIAADPRGALLADIERPGAGYLAANLPVERGKAAREVSDFRAERAGAKKLAQRAQEGSPRPTARRRISIAGSRRQRRLRGAACPERRRKTNSAAAIAAAAAAAAATDSPERSVGALRCRGRRRNRFCRAAGLVLVEPFLHFGG